MAYNNYNYGRVGGDTRGGAGSYEMSGMNGGGGGSTQDFFNEISSLRDSIQALNTNVSHISDLHSRSLSSANPDDQHRTSADLEQLVSDTRAMSNDLRGRIKSLERTAGAAGGRDGQMKKQQVAAVKAKFVEAIEQYQSVESSYQKRYKERLGRQFKIVKPNATDDEVRAVVNNEGGGGQVFRDALMSSNRYDSSRAAYREVQDRHEDIKRIERTMAELGQLIVDMSILVEQQGEMIDHIDTTAGNVEKDTEQALIQTEKATDSARRARKGRWICFWIAVVVIIVVIIVVLVVLKPWELANKKSNNSSPSSTPSQTAKSG